MSKHITPDLSGWIGDDLSFTPYLSPIGQIIRLSRLNRTRTYQIGRSFGLSSTIASALRGHRPPPWVDLSRWQRTHHAGALGWEAFLPFQPLVPENLGAHLRVCLACARYGYHTMAHQLQWIDVCPWHRTRLHDRCPCGRRWLSAKPEDDQDRLLACPCGRDAFNRHQGLLGMQRFPADAIRARLNDLLTQARQSAARDTLVIAPGVDRAKAYADVIDAERSSHVLPEAACDSPGGTTSHGLISAIRAIGNDQGSIGLPEAYERRIGIAATASLHEKGRRGFRVLPVEVTDIGVFLHRMPVMSRWPSEVQARLHRWFLNSDWSEIVGRLVCLSLGDRTPSAKPDSEIPKEDMRTLLRLLNALYELLCLDTIAYVTAALTTACRPEPTTLRRPHRQRLVVLIRNQPTTSFVVGLTRTP